MNGDIVNTRLQHCFDNINDWLKFAEAKNGILFAFNGGAVLGLLSLYEDIPTMIKTATAYILVPSFTLSLIVLLISFVPLRDKFFRHEKGQKDFTISDINLLYYGDIRWLAISDYLKFLHESDGLQIPNSFSNFQKDMAHQILNNSAIAHNKFTFFTICAYMNLVGIILSIIFVLIELA